MRELAGLPGLLARVDPVILEPAPAVEPVPGHAAALARARGRTRRRRRLFATVGVGAAAAVAMGAMAVAGLGGGDAAGRVATPVRPSSTAQPANLSMIPVGGAPVTGSLAFTPVGWGTKLDLTCSYRPDWDAYETAPDGHLRPVRGEPRRQHAAGRHLAGHRRKTMHFSAGTAARRGDISAVEVRTKAGRPVLQLQS